MHPLIARRDGREVEKGKQENTVRPYRDPHAQAWDKKGDADCRPVGAGRFSSMMCKHIQQSPACEVLKAAAHFNR